MLRLAATEYDTTFRSREYADDAGFHSFPGDTAVTSFSLPLWCVPVLLIEVQITCQRLLYRYYSVQYTIDRPKGSCITVDASVRARIEKASIRTCVPHLDPVALSVWLCEGNAPGTISIGKRYCSNVGGIKQMHSEQCQYRIKWLGRLIVKQKIT